jgi:CHAT domain
MAHIQIDPSSFTITHGLSIAGAPLPHSIGVALARGLCGKYYDGLEEITIDWFENEEVTDIRGLLAEHFARFSENCAPYEAKAFGIVTAEPGLKSRILVGAEGKRLYRMIKEKDAIADMPDLFQGQEAGLGTRIIGMQNTLPSLDVLFLAAAPLNESRLRLDQEARDLKEKLKQVEKPKVSVVLTHEWAVRTDQLQDFLLNQRPTLLHFSGHGGGGDICFEDGNGNSAPVTGTDFAELLKLGGASVQCVILNACFSSEIASLIDSPIKCVIGCDDSIDDGAASVFSKAFYRALAHGKTFSESFRLARNDVSMQCGSTEADKYLFREI